MHDGDYVKIVDNGGRMYLIDVKEIQKLLTPVEFGIHQGHANAYLEVRK